MYKLLILLFACGSAFAQRLPADAEKISERSLGIDQLKGSGRGSYVTAIDSISVRVNEFIGVIETYNYFKKSNIWVEVDLHYYHDDLIMASVRELSPTGLSGADWENIFFYENKKLFYTYSRYGVPAETILPKGEDFFKAFNYNKYLTQDFLKQYVMVLAEKIKG